MTERIRLSRASVEAAAVERTGYLEQVYRLSDDVEDADFVFTPEGYRALESGPGLPGQLRGCQGCGQ